MAHISIAVPKAILLSMLTTGAGVPAQAEELEDMITAKAAALEVLHRKAKRSLVGVAQDPSYRDYFTAHSHDHQHELKQRIDQISLEAQHKFDVGEMCLIDGHGHEISRIVEGEIAHDLSIEEAQAIFFKPGFALAPLEVYVSPIYMSPDVNRWVVAYVTPIMVEGENKAILHYEHELDIYHDLLAEGLSDGDRWLLAVNEDGWIVADSRRDLPTEKLGELEAPEDYFQQFAEDEPALDALRERFASGEGGSAKVTLGGTPHGVAWRTVERWTLVGFQRESN